MDFFLLCYWTFVSSKCFLMKLLEFSICNTMPPANSDSFTSSFPMCMLSPPPLILVWLLWLRLSILCWIKLVTVGILVLFLTLEEKVSAFHHSVWMLALGLSYITFITLSYMPTIPTLSIFFFINGCWILSNAYPASITMHCLNKWMGSGEVIVRSPSWLLGRPLKESRSSVN